MQILEQKMIDINPPLLRLLPDELFDLLIDLNSFRQHILQNLSHE